MERQATPQPTNRVPVSIISGFLGSGKTTLLNRLVRHPAMADAALIVNEFGEIGIDHALIDSALENAVVMDSGCVCCTIRGDLMDTIDDLFAKAAAGLLPRFTKILIEPTGLADPAPIVQALDRMEAAGHPCTCNAVVTMVDGQQGLRQLDAHEEASRQIAVADVVLITKTDLAAADVLHELAGRIGVINPDCPVRSVVHGEIDPVELFRLASRAVTRVPIAHHHAHEHRLHGDIASLAIATDRPVSWSRLRGFLESVYSLRGDAFLRAKGIVWISETGRPVLLQGVGNAFSPPRPLARDPGETGRSRLVFIFKGLDGAALERTFRAMVLDGGPDATPSQDSAGRSSG